MFLPRSAASRAMAVAVALLAVVALVHAEPCTTTTCPPGPVTATFASLDCSGSPTFEMVTNGDAPIVYDACITASPYNSYYYYATQTMFGMMSLNNPSCTMGLANQSSTDQSSVFGICKPNSNTNMATMLLSGVNATYTAPQVLQPSPIVYPDFVASRVEAECLTPNNCTYQGIEAQYWTTRNDDTCTVHQSSIGLFNISYDGACYRTADYSSQSSNCLNEHTTMDTLYVGNGCQVVSDYIITLQTCTSSNPVDFHCTATPINPPPALAPTMAPMAPMTTPMTTPSATPGMEAPTDDTPSPSAPASSLLPSTLLVLTSIIVLFF